MWKKIYESHQFVVKAAVCAVLAGVLQTGVHAQADSDPSYGTGSGPESIEQWRNYRSARIAQANAEHPSVVFFRPSNALQGQAVNIFINGEYQASLLPGAYTQAEACSGENRLTASYTDITTRYLEKTDQGQRFNLRNGEITYYSVVMGADKHPELQAVPAELAVKLIDQLPPLQRHTVPRVIGAKCATAVAIAPVPVEPPVPVSEKFVLQAGALFEYKKYEPQHMLAQGRREIADFVQTLRERHIQIDSLNVVGHTDPVADQAYNQQLSQRRAQTVAHILTQEGIDPRVISATGMGKSQLIVTDCQTRFPGAADKAQKDQCNQPNRRVELFLRGSVRPSPAQ